MKKVVNSNASLYEIIKTYPELASIMNSLGFSDLINPVVLNSLGRTMTIPAGAREKNIDIDLVKKTFSDNNFDLNPK